jgi:hypothetical protein
MKHHEKRLTDAYGTRKNGSTIYDEVMNKLIVCNSIPCTLGQLRVSLQEEPHFLPQLESFPSEFTIFLSETIPAHMKTLTLTLTPGFFVLCALIQLRLL